MKLHTKQTLYMHITKKIVELKSDLMQLLHQREIEISFFLFPISLSRPSLSFSLPHPLSLTLPFPHLKIINKLR